MKDTGPAWRATAVANRDTRERIEKVSADAVTLRIVFGKDDGLAGGLLGDMNGVDSSTTASSWSWAGDGCEGVGDDSRSAEDSGMV